LCSIALYCSKEFGLFASHFKNFCTPLKPACTQAFDFI
jgi:hypothetical protein